MVNPLNLALLLALAVPTGFVVGVTLSVTAPCAMAIANDGAQRTGTVGAHP